MQIIGLHLEWVLVQKDQIGKTPGKQAALFCLPPIHLGGSGRIGVQRLRHRQPLGRMPALGAGVAVCAAARDGSVQADKGIGCFYWRV